MESQNQVLAGCGIVGTLVLLIFFLVSFDTVGPLETGIQYNVLTKTVNTEKYFEPGYYWNGPFKNFILFPSKRVNIEFSSLSSLSGSSGDSSNMNGALQTRTKDGLLLKLHISFQYRLVKSELGTLYLMNNKYYEQTYKRIARDSILQVLGQYTGQDFWLNRKEIQNALEEGLATELERAHATCEGVQILKIELPSQYESSIVVTQVEIQKKQLKMYEQEAISLQSLISIKQSEYNQRIKEVNAEAEAVAYSTRKSAEAFMHQAILDAERDSYLIIKEQLDLTPSDLSLYMYYIGLLDRPNVNLIVNSPNTFVSTGTSSLYK